MITPATTVFSEDRMYRYTLWREWGWNATGNYAAFIGLNPSTADESNDDPTIRRCIDYAKRWGYDGLMMLNLFAYRSTSPLVMKAYSEPVGPDNDRWLASHQQTAKVIVAAWGNDGYHMGRSAQVRALIPNLHCLRVTSTGHPWHPLYLPKTLTPIPLP